jgi:hypothetical protein
MVWRDPSNPKQSVISSRNGYTIQVTTALSKPVVVGSLLKNEERRTTKALDIAEASSPFTGERRRVISFK